VSEDLDKRLAEAVAERDRLAAAAQRIAGRKEAAERALRAIEDEIRAKNLDPDKLDETISQLETAYQQAVVKLEKDVASAKEALSPYMENTQS